jgi:hypothetical protein
MTGLVAYLAAVVAVAVLIPWPFLWPLSLALFVVSYVLAPSPRNNGGKLAGRRDR